MAAGAPAAFADGTQSGTWWVQQPQTWCDGQGSLWVNYSEGNCYQMMTNEGPVSVGPDGQTEILTQDGFNSLVNAGVAEGDEATGSAFPSDLPASDVSLGQKVWDSLSSAADYVKSYALDFLKGDVGWNLPTGLAVAFAGPAVFHIGFKIGSFFANLLGIGPGSSAGSSDPVGNRNPESTNGALLVDAGYNLCDDSYTVPCTSANVVGGCGSCYQTSVHAAITPSLGYVVQFSLGSGNVNAVSTPYYGANLPSGAQEFTISDNCTGNYFPCGQNGSQSDGHAYAYWMPGRPPTWADTMARSNPFSRIIPGRVRKKARSYANRMYHVEDLVVLRRLVLPPCGKCRGCKHGPGCQKEGRGRAVLDEAHQWLNARTWDADETGRAQTKAEAVRRRLDIIKFFATHRHRGWHIELITQDDLNLDRQVRTLFETHTHLKNLRRFKLLGILPIVPVNVFVAVKTWHDNDRTRLGVETFMLNRRLARCYDTFGAARELENDPDAIYLGRNVDQLIEEIEEMADLQGRRHGHAARPGAAVGPPDAPPDRPIDPDAVLLTESPAERPHDAPPSDAPENLPPVPTAPEPVLNAETAETGISTAPTNLRDLTAPNGYPES